MTVESPNERMKRSVENLVRAGGRVVTVRLTPAANAVLHDRMNQHPGTTTTRWINQALENMPLSDADPKDR